MRAFLNSFVLLLHKCPTFKLINFLYTLMRKMFVALRQSADKEQSPSSQSFSYILSHSYSSSLFPVYVFLFLYKEMEPSMVFQCKFNAEEIYFAYLLCC